jgi:hypothetical protein
MRRLGTALVTALVTLLSTALVLLAPVQAGSATSAASAAEPPRRQVSVSDPDDVISTLDLRQVRLTAKGSRIDARFTTYDVFSAQDLDGANGLYLRFGLGKGRYREVLVQSLSEKWTGTICSGRVGRLTIDRDCATLPTRRTSDRSLVVSIPRALIEKNARVYRWNAWSDVWIQSAGCDGSGPCDDYIAPEGSYLRWRAPAVPRR